MKPATSSCLDRAVDILLEGLKENNPLLESTGFPTGLEPHSLAFADALSATLSQFSSKVYERITSVRRSRNSLSPIHRLPPEILTSVFLLSFLSREGRVARLKKLASVCSYWTAFILTTPLLWSHISDFDHPTSVTTALTRSRRSPLSIDFFRGPTERGHWNILDLSHAMEALIPEAGRWKNVELEVSPQSYDDMLVLQEATVPILESLKIIIDKKVNRLHRYPLTSETLDLFGGRAERLRALHLDGIALSWTSPLLTQVTDLVLAGVCMTRVQLYNLLSLNPNLKRLSIPDLLPSPSHEQTEQPWSPPSRIEHNSLELVAFGRLFSNPAPTILAHLAMPRCTSLTVNMGNQPPSGSLSDKAHQTLAHISHHISAASFNYVRVVWVLQSGPAPGAYFKVEGSLRSPHSYDLRFTIPVKYSPAGTWIQSIMELLNPIVPTLDVGVEFVWSNGTRHVGGTEPLMRFLGNLPNVKTMCNRYGIDGRLLKLMSRPEWSGERMVWLFAELEDFTLESVYSTTSRLEERLAGDLLMMAKKRFGGVISQYDFGDDSDPDDGASDSDSDSDTHTNSSDSNGGSDEASGSNPIHTPDHTQSETVLGPFPAPPPCWKTLRLSRLDDEVCAEIRAVASGLSMVEHHI